MTAVIQHRLRPFGQSDLHHQDPHALHVILAQGRGSAVRVPAHWMSVCGSLRARVCLQSAHLEWALEAGRCQLWNNGALQCRASDAHGWLLIAAPRELWPTAMLREPGETLLSPWQGRISRDLARALIAATRVDGMRVDGMRADSLHASSQELGAAVIESLARRQSDLHGLLERCAGRTQHLRQQTMSRLLRVRHAILCDPGQRQDLDQLATLANYSPCHLLRMHRRVFGETPFEYASRLRDRRALELLRGTDLSVLDISLRLGFESQSAFCRAFKISFGATPTDMRRDALQSTPRAA